MPRSAICCSTMASRAAVSSTNHYAARPSTESMEYGDSSGPCRCRTQAGTAPVAQPRSVVSYNPGHAGAQQACVSPNARADRADASGCRQSPVRALWSRDVPHARGLALSCLPLQDGLLRLVTADAVTARSRISCRPPRRHTWMSSTPRSIPVRSCSGRTLRA